MESNHTYLLYSSLYLTNFIILSYLLEILFKDQKSHRYSQVPYPIPIVSFLPSSPGLTTMQKLVCILSFHGFIW